MTREKLKIQTVLNMKGMTQQRLANILSVTQPYINQMLHSDSEVYVYFRPDREILCIKYETVKEVEVWRDFDKVPKQSEVK